MREQKDQINDHALQKMGTVELVDTIISIAIQKGASDIHIEPFHELSIRMRIDGMMEHVAHIPVLRTSEIISRIKVLARLRSDEHALPQDGRFVYKSEAERDIRVSIMPTHHGENAVLRIMSEDRASMDLSELGYDESSVTYLQQKLAKTSGMILVTGPTGSGKTSTLYALIRELKKYSASIVTVEDPIEYGLLQVTQIPAYLHPSSSFPRILRSVLRQDPDVVMVGEIRDAETARIAVNTCLTGHLLLSSIHTGNAVSVIPRLLDMGIERYLIAATLKIVIAQRLVRVLCSACKEERVCSDDEILRIAELVPEVWKYVGSSSFFSVGCVLCRGKGYSGRVVVYEVFDVDEYMRERILAGDSAGEIGRLAKRKGMKSIIEDCLAKVAIGKTSYDELFRILYE